MSDNSALHHAASQQQAHIPDDGEARRFPPPNWQRHLVLFLLTVASVFFAGAQMEAGPPPAGSDAAGAMLFLIKNLPAGWPFAVPLLAILLCHEFGHYFAAMWHRVPASLPYFIPLPMLSPFGTMGAVISMPKRIRSRNALMDIGAAGPLAGLGGALPALVGGLAPSEGKTFDVGGMMEGQSLLYWLLKRLVVGEIPAGHDVFLSSTAFAGWVGLLITALNLFPVGQLDGGHIAYALFDRLQLRIAPILHFGMLAVFAYNYIHYGLWTPGLVWLVWFVLLHGMRRMGGGLEHPPTEEGALSPARKLIGVLCLVLFVLLFMPTPMYMPPSIDSLTPLFERALAAAQW